VVRRSGCGLWRTHIETAFAAWEHSGCVVPALTERVRRRPFTVILSLVGGCAFVVAAVASSAPTAAVPVGRIAFASPWADNFLQAELYQTGAGGGSRRNISRTPQIDEESFAVSPDGRSLAFVALVRSKNTTFRGLYVSRADGTRRRRLASTLDRVYGRPAWSPDGRRIAVASVTPAPRIYVVDLKGAASSVGQLGGGGGNPVWSPNGRQLAFIGGNAEGWGLVVSTPDGAQARVFDAFQAEGAAWSPDGASVAFGTSSELLVVDLANGDVRKLVDGRAGAPRWSPDGREIAFARYDDNVSLWVVSRDGGVARRIAGAGSYHSYYPAWSPDGSQIAFIRSTTLYSGASYVAVVRRDGTRERAVSPEDPFAQVLDHEWRGDRQIVYLSIRRANDREIFTMTSDGRGAKALTTNFVEDVEPAWSPDGRRIAFVSGDGDYRNQIPRDVNVSGSIHVMNNDGTGRRRITRGTDDHSPTWSRDGRRIAFVREDDVYIVAARAGAIPTLLSADRQWRSFYPRWSPDGERIACVRDGAIHTIEVRSRTVRRLTPADGNDSQPEWSPDSRAIAFTRQRSGTDVYVMDADGTGVRRLTANRDSSTPTWSRDGRWIVYIRGGFGAPPQALYMMRPDGRGRRLIRSAIRYIYDPAWQPMPAARP
jgi:TolB protein